MRPEGRADFISRSFDELRDVAVGIAQMGQRAVPGLLIHRAGVGDAYCRKRHVGRSDDADVEVYAARPVATGGEAATINLQSPTSAG